MIVRVLPDVAGIDKAFDYRVPASMRAVRVGDIVRVPLNSRSVAGWVLEILEDGESDHGDKVLDVSKWSSRGPNEEILELARWAAHRYVGRLRTVLTPASPERNVASLPATQRSIHVDEKLQIGRAHV